LTSLLFLLHPSQFAFLADPPLSSYFNFPFSQSLVPLLRWCCSISLSCVDAQFKSGSCFIFWPLFLHTISLVHHSSPKYFSLITFLCLCKQRNGNGGVELSLFRTFIFSFLTLLPHLSTLSAVMFMQEPSFSGQALHLLNNFLYLSPTINFFLWPNYSLSPHMSLLFFKGNELSTDLYPFRPVFSFLAFT